MDEKKLSNITNHSTENSTFVTNIIDGDYNLTDATEGDSKFPLISMTTRNSLLYLQYISLGGHAGIRHYTDRENLDSYLFILTRQGCGELFYRGKTYTLTTGDCFFIDCAQKHFYRTTSESGWSYDLIHMNGETLPQLYSVFFSNECCALSIGSKNQVMKLIQNIFTVCDQNTVLSELQVHRYLTDLIAELTEANLGKQYLEMPPKITSVCDYISANYQKKLTLESIAEVNFISKYHLCREFKKYTGKTPIEYVTLLRIHIAKGLLVSTDLPIQEIAESVGIMNTNYFFYVFKKVEGISPNEYRKRWE